MHTDQPLTFRKVSDPVIYSNGLFLLNSLLWFWAGYSWTSVIVAVAALTSFGYHFPREGLKLTHDLDVSFAYVALAFTLSVAHPYLSLTDYTLLSILVAFGLWAKSRAHSSGHYDGYHTLWHVVVSMGQAYLALAILWTDRIT